jgi:hypothetical protein
LRLTFVLLSATGLAYFLLARRRFDLLSLGFVSSCLYFLPGFFGFVQRPTEDFVPPLETPLVNDAYIVYCLVLAAVLVGGLLVDRIVWRPFGLRFPSANPASVAVIALTLAYVGFFFVASLGGRLLEPDKSLVLESLDRWHVVMTSFATVAAVAGLVCRRWRLVAAAAPPFALDLVVGIRATTALALMAGVLVWLASEPPGPVMLRHRRLAVSAAILAFVFFTWQQVYAPLKQGNWPVVIQRLSTPTTFSTAVVQSEPFTTQAILNEVLQRDYHVPAAHLLDAAAAAVPLYTKFFAKPVSFNDLFQPDLFPGIRRTGLANNFWAEAMATGGYPLLLVYIGLYVVLLAIASLVLRSSGPNARAMAALGGAYLAFYVHRNDLLVEVILERRVLGAYLVALLLASLLARALDRAGAAADETA